MIESISIGLGMGIIVIAAILALIFGIRNITYGKSDLKRVLAMAVPFVIFGIAYAITGAIDQSGMITLLTLMSLMVLGIVISSARRTFNI
ncbi:hypothetical protein [Rhodohalobacter sp. 8-1]|uniref:hypothetical protein n=1 Tax=Rhodohalobacter sp. 8-1 TaxID=3131972 RepID=UPI0030EBC127